MHGMIDTTVARGPLVVVAGDAMVATCKGAGLRHVIDGSPFNLLGSDGKVRHEVDFFGDYVILIPEGGEGLRDTIAINLGDERCRWAYLPLETSEIVNTVATARPMWT